MALFSGNTISPIFCSSSVLPRPLYIENPSTMDVVEETIWIIAGLVMGSLFVFCVFRNWHKMWSVGKRLATGLKESVSSETSPEVDWCGFSNHFVHRFHGYELYVHVPMCLASHVLAISSLPYSMAAYFAIFAVQSMAFAFWALGIQDNKAFATAEDVPARFERCGHLDTFLSISRIVYVC
jgi:hypothetical protein